MKKSISVVLALVMLLAIAVPMQVSAVDGRVATIESVEAFAGETVVVPIVISGNTGSIGGFQFYLAIDDALTVVETAFNEVDYTYAASASNGTSTFVCAYTVGAEASEAEFWAAYVKVTVPAGAVAGTEYAINFTGASKLAGTDPGAMVGGKVTVVEQKSVATPDLYLVKDGTTLNGVIDSFPLTNLVISEDITEIAEAAVYGWDTIDNVTILNKDAVIGTNAFGMYEYQTGSGKNKVTHYEVVENFKVYGFAGSTAETWAAADDNQGETNSITFVALTEAPKPLDFNVAAFDGYSLRFTYPTGLRAQFSLDAAKLAAVEAAGYTVTVEIYAAKTTTFATLGNDWNSTDTRIKKATVYTTGDAALTTFSSVITKITDANMEFNFIVKVTAEKAGETTQVTTVEASTASADKSVSIKDVVTLIEAAGDLDNYGTAAKSFFDTVLAD